MRHYKSISAAARLIIRCGVQERDRLILKRFSFRLKWFTRGVRQQHNQSFLKEKQFRLIDGIHSAIQTISPAGGA